MVKQEMEAAYNHIQKLAAYHFTKNPDFDFQTVLDRMKEIKGIKEGHFEWQNGHAIGGLKEKIMPLPEYSINGYGEKIIHRRNHFMMAIFRTVESESTVSNLLQIGFHTGLVKTGMKVSDYPEGVVKLFRDFKLDHISNYISKLDLTALDIPDDILNSISRAFNLI